MTPDARHHRPFAAHLTTPAVHCLLRRCHDTPAALRLLLAACFIFWVTFLLIHYVIDSFSLVICLYSPRHSTEPYNCIPPSFYHLLLITAILHLFYHHCCIVLPVTKVIFLLQSCFPGHFRDLHSNILPVI